MSDIDRIAWDTRRDRHSTSGHWFFSIYTRDDEDSGYNDSDDDGADGQGGSYYDHQLTFALLNDENYTDDEWNTLEADKSDNDASGAEDGDGYLEVSLYDQQRISSFNDGDPDEADRDEFPAMTLAEWADEANDGNAPAWWNEEIRFAALSTGTGYNEPFTSPEEPGSTFLSNLDNFQFSYDTGDVSNVVTLDLEATAVPTPTAGVLGLVGFGLLALRRRRRGESV